MTSPDARLARVETLLADLKEDMADLKGEGRRTRERLHDLEGVSAMLVDQEKLRREATGDRQRRLEIRMEILAVVVAVVAIVEPFLYHLAGGQ